MTAEPPPLFLVRGDATAEEVVAITAVLLQAAAATASRPSPKVRTEWSAPHRRLRQPHRSGPEGWRSSALPR